MNRLGVSGSVILSDPRKLEHLFWEGIHHIEIGELPNQEAWEAFLGLCKRHNATFGVHSPLYRDGSKYDLIEPVTRDTQIAWEQIEREAEYLSQAGAEYILIHFPYFTDLNVNDAVLTASAHGRISRALERLRALQDKFSIPFICEPKLGRHKSSAGIQILHQFPNHEWSEYGLGICIDVGDYLLATDGQPEEYISKWSRWVRIVHLHNVEMTEDRYIWIPVHPSHEEDEIHFPLQKHIEQLSRTNDVTFIFEHTPHSNPSFDFVEAGVHWVRGLIGGKAS